MAFPGKKTSGISGTDPFPRVNGTGINIFDQEVGNALFYTMGYAWNQYFLKKFSGNPGLDKPVSLPQITIDYYKRDISK